MGSLIILIAVGAFTTAWAVPGGIPICWRDSYIRGGGTIPKSCKATDELDGALCYPKCKDGYYGVGPVCWQSCPPDMHDGGVFCYGGGHPEFTKKSYGRGVGTIPGCPDGEQEQAALCYTPCASNWVQAGPVCMYDGSGNADYTAPCQVNFTTASHFKFLNPVIAYGKSKLDCENLAAELHYVALGGRFCIEWAINCIKQHELLPTKNCTSYVVDAVQQLVNTRLCTLPSTTPGSTSTSTTTAGSTTT